jgi:hypothetical protein
MEDVVTLAASGFSSLGFTSFDYITVRMVSARGFTISGDMASGGGVSLQSRSTKWLPYSTSVSNGSGVRPERLFDSVPEPSKTPIRSVLLGHTRTHTRQPAGFVSLARPVGSNLQFCVSGFPIYGRI